MKRIISAILLCLIICSCVQSDYTIYLEEVCKNSTTYVLDTPKNWHAYQNVKQNNKYLTLKLLDQPSDTFFLRIERTAKNAVKFFVYSYCNGISAFKIYTIPLAKDRKMTFDKQVDNIEQFVTTFDPLTKQQEFVNQLMKNDILGLPDVEQLKDYPDDEFAIGYTLEYAYKCKYKLFSYSNPHIHAKNFKEAFRLATFVDYLKLEFNF